MTEKFLDNVYDLVTAEKTKAFYDDWSNTYDTEVAENGYATPARAAEALAGVTTDRTEAIMDLGCGTGIAGAALRAAGFTTLDGSDFSAAMLEKAREKGIYRSLIKGDLGNEMPFADGAYRIITAIGVLNPGHAPAQLFDRVWAKLPKGGLFAFSLNDHALADPTYEGRLNEYLDCGAVRLLFREYGEHLPKIGLKSNVYVVSKT